MYDYHISKNLEVDTPRWYHISCYQGLEILFSFAHAYLACRLQPHGHRIAALPAGIIFPFKAGKRQVKGRRPMQAESFLF